MEDRMSLVRAELDAASDLAKEYRRLSMTAPVDDDFPEVKFDYDRAARKFVEAYNKSHS